MDDGGTEAMLAARIGMSARESSPAVSQAPGGEPGSAGPVPAGALRPAPARRHRPSQSWTSLSPPGFGSLRQFNRTMPGRCSARRRTDLRHRRHRADRPRRRRRAYALRLPVVPGLRLGREPGPSSPRGLVPGGRGGRRRHLPADHRHGRGAPRPAGGLPRPGGLPAAARSPALLGGPDPCGGPGRAAARRRVRPTPPGSPALSGRPGARLPSDKTPRPSPCPGRGTHSK